MGWFTRRGNTVKIPVRISSAIIAVLGWILFTGLTVFMFLVMQDRARLVRDNNNEQILNQLFTSLRDYDDYGSAIEATPALREAILGVAIYRGDLTPMYSWGKVPHHFDETILGKHDEPGKNRYTITERESHSIKFIIKTERGTPQMPPPPRSPMGRRTDEQQPHHFFFNSLDVGKYLYIDINQPAYWRSMNLMKVLFPLCELALLFLVFYMRNLFLRNIEYRERIESQKNLVVLGTAASTLAHEIKNPLLSIRLQAGILRKISSGTGEEEINIIEEEVDRLSALVYRVNDYLRDAAGFPVILNMRSVLQETFRRLCGGEIQGNPSGEYSVYMDSDRARSVLENIIRNALESGGPAEGIEAAISKSNGRVTVEILDRGKGISPEDIARIFDPFFTSKSTGTGIGLSISRRFVEAAKGTILVEPREGGGTRVCIGFPEYKTEESSRAAQG